MTVSKAFFEKNLHEPTELQSKRLVENPSNNLHLLDSTLLTYVCIFRSRRYQFKNE